MTSVRSSTTSVEGMQDHAQQGYGGVSEGLWTASQVAEFLRCSSKTVLQLVRHEGLPGFRLRSRLRFVPGDVLEWARRRRKEVY